MTTILIKKKDTSGAPSPGDLTNGSGGAELAVNTADKRLYTKNSGGSIVEVGTDPATFSVNSAYSFPTSDGTNGQVLTTDGSGALSFASPTVGTVTSVEVSGGTTGLTTSGGPITSSGTITLAGTLAVANGGTGITSFGTGVATAFGQNVTGSGGIVLDTSATLTTPTLGVATATSINKVAFTAPATGSTLTIADGKTAAFDNSITFAGTDSTTMTFPSSSATVAGLGIAQTFSAKQTFSGSSSDTAAEFTNIVENGTVSATAASSTINFDVLTQSVLYYTSDATGNWTLNLRGDSDTTLSSLLDVGDSIAVTFLVTNGGTAYYQSAFQVDGSSVTPKWQGGSAPTEGNTSSIDAYTIVVIKTAATPTYEALASVTQFA